LYSGVAALAGINGRDDYRAAAIRVWGDMNDKKTYITGGIGATAEGEAFGKDYVLPNDGYLETCGAAGAAFFDRNLNLLTGDARYADALERELYNGALTGVSLAGDSYTYVNPLKAENGNSRWAWNGCPCCPPMFLKLMGAMPGYIYAQDTNGIYVNLFVGSKAKIQFAGHAVMLKQTTGYPWHGEAKITFESAHASEFDLHVRIPGWCQGDASTADLYEAGNRPSAGAAHLRVNGKPVPVEIVKGYAVVHRRWKTGDTLQVDLDMPVQIVTANVKVEADKDRAALMRGPIVYCFEGADNGAAVQNFVISPETKFVPEYRDELLGGVTVLTGTATGMFRTGKDKGVSRPFKVTAIPYFGNANRGTCQMQVWMPEKSAVAVAQKQD
jgi:hypothetical protein